MPKTERSKRKRNDESPNVAASSSSQNLTYALAEALVRRVITQYNIDPTLLESEEDGAGVSSSKVTYEQVAPLVGLSPDSKLKDISTFEIHRSRLPTDLLRSIVADIDTMMIQYGPPHEHMTEEARSRFFSPIFNHLVKQFTFMLRNNPETIIDGRIGTRGRIEYFKAFGAVAFLCIEMKLSVGNVTGRLNTIAQVIAECDGCDVNNNKRGFSLPILCILSDGVTFEFFKFERNGSSSSFFRGCFPGDPILLQRGLTLPTTDSPLPFILQLRCVCETVFDVMLSAYIHALNTYYGRSASAGTTKGVKRPSLDNWDRALKFAGDALATFRRAETQREDGDIDSADNSVLEGLGLLHESTGAVSTVYESRLVLPAWDEDEVKKA